MAGNIKSCVVDASFVLTYLYPLERTKTVEKIFDQCRDGKIRLLSTKLLPFEVLNSARWAVLRNKVSLDQAESIVNAFFDLDIEYGEIDYQDTFKLAVKKGLTVYDTSYLILALANKVKLLTFDKQLEKVS
ncbi:hypothetical protein COY91_03185 [Candidatus Shapirobacteria bacterium CG_4_10_14_0_8_um_filter_39_15]|nr:MAG: hypothetical protein COY91_03185 [Candidatus Shapirobacteria bacterium CG_4_10_14_0_8_um_filter_39_15]PJE68054.1 MAG: hypothetical protein COU94_03815 [Candidatus Shapirobacteria bacterium CG10_big_fil_rev_8_21_14_0_10_38_8]